MEQRVFERTWIQGKTPIPDDLSSFAFQGEASADKFIIDGKTASGTAVDITGTIIGVYLGENNNMVPLVGTLSDGKAMVTLDDPCYKIPGRFILSIYAVNGTQTICIYCGIGIMFRTQSARLAYPSKAIPDIQELLDDADAVISDVNAAVEAAQSESVEIIESIKSKGEETLESIPDDYTALSNDVGDLKTAVDSVLVNGGHDSVTLTNSINVTSYYNANSGSMMRISNTNGVALFKPAENSNEKSPYTRDLCALGSGKWLVGFKYRYNKLDQDLGDPQIFDIILGQSRTLTHEVQWGEWIDFSDVYTYDLTRIYIRANTFATSPTQSQLSFEIKDVYVYEVTDVDSDLIDIIKSKQSTNYQDGTVTYGTSDVYLPDTTLTLSGKAADSKTVGDKFDEFYTTASKSLTNAVSLNNMAAYSGMTRDSITSGVATYSPSSSPDTSPSVRDYCNLGTGNRIVSFKYKITKNDQGVGDPQYIRLFLGSEEHHYSVIYDEWCYVQLFTTVDLTRVYLILQGYSTAPTSGQITLQIKDYYVYNISDVSGEMLFYVINKQKTDYKDGTVSYSITYQSSKVKPIINAKDYGVAGDGIVDDTDTINALLRSFSGVIYFPKGSYKLSGTIEVSANTELYGDGNDTVFSMTSFYSLNRINSRIAFIRPYILIRSDNVTIRNIKLIGNSNYVEQFQWGIAIIGANQVNISNATVLNINCNFDEAVNSVLGYGISAMNSNYVVIENCNVQNCGYECIGFFDGNEHGIVRDCYTEDGKRTCIQVHRDNSSILVQNNYMKQTNDKYDSCLVIHGLYGGTEIYDLRIENNTMECTQDGAQAEDYCAPAQIMSDVYGCWFENNNIFGGKRALYVNGSVHDCHISGNVMQCNENSDYGILCASSYAVIIGNRIDNDASSGNSITQNPVIVGNVGIE